MNEIRDFFMKSICEKIREIDAGQLQHGRVSDKDRTAAEKRGFNPGKRKQTIKRLYYQFGSGKAKTNRVWETGETGADGTGDRGRKRGAARDRLRPLPRVSLLPRRLLGRTKID